MRVVLFAGVLAALIAAPMSSTFGQTVVTPIQRSTTPSSVPQQTAQTLADRVAALEAQVARMSQQPNQSPLRGPVGPAGPQGPQGEPGPQGPRGAPADVDIYFREGERLLLQPSTRGQTRQLNCQDGDDVALYGFFRASRGQAYITGSYPQTPSSWTLDVINPSPTDAADVTTYVACRRVS